MSCLLGLPGKALNNGGGGGDGGRGGGGGGADKSDVAFIFRVSR